MIKQIGDKRQLVIDLEIPGEQPKIRMGYKSDGEYYHFHCKGVKILPEVPFKSSVSTQHKMKNEIINFRFKIPSDNINIDKCSQRIEYVKENNEYNGIVRITYDIEEEEEEPEERTEL